MEQGLVGVSCLQNGSDDDDGDDINTNNICTSIREEVRIKEIRKHKCLENCKVPGQVDIILTLADDDTLCFYRQRSVRLFL